MAPSFEEINPFDTMRFQYFSFIYTGMRGTYAHLPVLTLIQGLKLNNAHEPMDEGCESTADYLNPVYNFLPLCHMT